jgi:hypothetical protein
MSALTQDDLQRQVQNRLQKLPPAPWVRDMIRHFHRTGLYRPEDLQRLLGDQTKGVEVGPSPSLSELLQS